MAEMDDLADRRRRPTRLSIPSPRAIDTGAALELALARVAGIPGLPCLTYEGAPAPRVLVPGPLLERTLEKLLLERVHVPGAEVRVRFSRRAHVVSLFVEPVSIDSLDPTFAAALEEHGVSVVVRDSTVEIQLPSSEGLAEARP